VATGDDTDDGFVDLSQLGEILGVGRSRAYAVSRDRTFPEPAVVRPRIRLWRRVDVEAWMDAHRPNWRDTPS
jgi:predicted DNA-binding transcriptional regulator AlpA